MERGSKKRKWSEADYTTVAHQHPSANRQNSYRLQQSQAKGWTASEQARINKIQEDERHREFLAKEGQFVLQQKRKAADIRVREGRARPIDWLTVNLRLIDPVEDLINDDMEETKPEYIDPQRTFQRLSSDQLLQLRQDIDSFLDLERKASNIDYWKMLKILCSEQQKGLDGRAVKSVSSDIDDLLRPKSLDQLEKLEKQIRRKLDSNEPIDTDYWQQLLESLLVYQAQAKLKNIYASILEERLNTSRAQNALKAKNAVAKMCRSSPLPYDLTKAIDPQPLLNLDASEKSTAVVDERIFIENVASSRVSIARTGYIVDQSFNNIATESARSSRARPESHTHASSSFDRDVAKGIEEDEEVFTGEEQVETKATHHWHGKYRPRKPRYFNRVQMGYEWNKYNQTHYDHDNPPPKVVQGYKFHIFYPDLIDPTKAPTYKITREGGRKKGETVAPAGEEDTCIIRFLSGPPYEDIAFRIVDRDWDYSAKHDRGFKSTFEKGILTLHFSFKKVYYRK